MTDNKKFWKSVKPLLNENIKTSSTIVLMENDELVSEDREVANILNEYFSNVANSLNIADNNESVLPVDGISDAVTAAIEKYRSHPSVLLIKSNCEDVEAFSFSEEEKLKI